MWTIRDAFRTVACLIMDYYHMELKQRCHRFARRIVNAALHSDCSDVLPAAYGTGLTYDVAEWG